MFVYIKENPEEFIAVFTVISALLLNLLGFGDEELKEKKLKVILLSYGIIFMLVLTAGERVTLFLFIFNISLFLFGGLMYGTNGNQDLEKELNLFRFIIYNSSAWLLLAQNYIILALTIIQYFLILLFQIFNFSLFFITLILSVVSIFSLFIQYLLVIKDYFNLNHFSKVLSQLSQPKTIALNMGAPNKRFNNLKENQMKLLAFVIYCEDKNFFERKSNTINFIDVKMKFKNPSIFKEIVIDEESRRRTYFRGYSTIEQQLVRQFSMAAYSYRYTFRRKLFNDWLYTPLFCRSICDRKARTYGKKKKKKARKELMWNLKYMMLIQYYVIVLRSPKNPKDLIKEMSKHSRVSIPVYDEMYSIFKDSNKVNYYMEQIKDNAAREFNFY
ncbi:hypothetical protein [Enterococcus sp. N342-3-1-2]